MDMWGCTWCFNHLVSPACGYHEEPTGVVDLPNDHITQIKFKKCLWFGDCIDLYAIEFFYEKDTI